MNIISEKSVLPEIVSVDSTKRRIDIFLSSLFDERIAQAKAISPDYAQLWQSIAQLTLAGGKRLRPYVILLAYTMDGRERNDDAIIPAAAAQELLHMAMLIHDDIIDRDQIRYGVKNVTAQYDDLYKPYIKDRVERRHFSNSAAIMAGDLLIAEAYSLIQQCDVNASHKAKAQAVLSEAIFRVVGGELLDTESAFRPFDDVSALLIAQQKTASYSFIGPLTMGAHLANLPPETIDNLTQFGGALGVAYQLQDDLLGAFGNEAVTGKSSSGDIIEGKHTHLIEQFYARARTDQIVAFDAIFKNHQATPSDIAEARQLLTDSGAVAAVQYAIDKLSNSARTYLDKIEMSETYRITFDELIELCIKRSK